MTRHDLIRAAAVSRDLLMVVVGLLLLADTPPSVQEFSPNHLIADMWATALVAGGLVSGYGVLRQKVSAEIVGCFTVGGAFLVWSISAISQPDPTKTSVAVSIVFLAGAVGQIFRGAAAPFVAAATMLTDDKEH